MARVTAEEPKRLVKKALDTSYLSDYAGLWVLVVDGQVVDSSDSPQPLAEQISKGYTGDTYLFKVPKPDEGLLVISIA